MSDAFICDYVRTPIGRYGGALAGVRADDLAALPIRELLRRHPGLEQAVEEVFLGSANQAGEDNRNVARMALLLAGLPDSVPGSTVNRLCASGMEAIAAASRAIRTGEIEVAVAGGSESMTRAPLVMGKAEQAFQRSAEVLRHDHRLALRQSADEGAVRRRLDARDGAERRRRASGVPPGSGRLRAALAKPNRDGAGERDVRRRNRFPSRSRTARARFGTFRRTSTRARMRRSRVWRSCAASSVPTAASPRATPRGSTTARRR